MQKGKGKGGGGGEQGPSSSSSSSTSPPKGIIINHKDFNQELEQATIEKYRRINKDTNASWSMILYRMNAWKGKPEREERVVDDNPEVDILDQYSGRMDLYVDNEDKHFSCALPRYAMQRTTGDFSFSRWLFCPNDEKVLWDIHCVITGPDYAADHIWVTGKTHETFLNGESIPEGESYRLMDGDVIGLGSPHDSSEHWEDDKGKRGFVFKVKNIKVGGEQSSQNEEDAEDEGSSPEFLALNNNVILGEMVKFLSYKELKTARLINKFWKRMVDPEIFSRTVVWFMDPPKFCYFNNRTYFPFTVSMTELYYFSNWRMNIDSRDVETSLIDEFMRIIKKRGHSIRNLQLTLSFESKEDGDHFISILRNLPNLETLELTAPDDRDRDMIPILGSSSPTASTPIFTSVRHLCVDNYSRGNDIVVSHVAPVLPNIQKITTRGCLLRVLELIAEQSLWTTGLKEICGEELGCFRITQAECFNIIRALPNRLTKLKLRMISPFRSVSDITMFENMLQEHSETLEHLMLSFRNKRESKEQSDSETLFLRLPVFPKLKTLEFVSQNHEDFPFQITFPTCTSGRIRYESDFPQIYRLRLLGVGYTSAVDPGFNGKAILDIFIPKDSDTVSGTMGCLEFKVGEHNRRKDDEWYNEFLERFQRMFPHVDYPHFP